MSLCLPYGVSVGTRRLTEHTTKTSFLSTQLGPQAKCCGQARHTFSSLVAADYNRRNVDDSQQLSLSILLFCARQLCKCVPTLVHHVHDELQELFCTVPRRTGKPRPVKVQSTGALINPQEAGKLS